MLGYRFFSGPCTRRSTVEVFFNQPVNLMSGNIYHVIVNFPRVGQYILGTGDLEAEDVALGYFPGCEGVIAGVITHSNAIIKPEEAAVRKRRMGMGMEWASNLPNLATISIPRCYFPRDQGRQVDSCYELHVFSDASQ